MRLRVFKKDYLILQGVTKGQYMLILFSGLLWNDSHLSINWRCPQNSVLFDSKRSAGRLPLAGCYAAVRCTESALSRGTQLNLRGQPPFPSECISSNTAKLTAALRLGMLSLPSFKNCFNLLCSILINASKLLEVHCPNHCWQKTCFVCKVL